MLLFGSFTGIQKMLVIREEQLNVLKKYMLDQFEDRMLTHLRKNFSEHTKTLDDQYLREMIRFGIERAKKYDVILEDDVRQYLEYMIMYSPNFDQIPETAWAGKILRDNNINGTEKMRQIDNVSLFLFMK